MSTVISHVLLGQTHLQSTVPGGPGEDLLRLRGSHGSPRRRSRGWVSKDFIGMTRDGEAYVRCVQKQKGLKQRGYLGLFKELSVINAARVYKAGQRRGWKKQAGALGCRTCTRRCAKRFVMQAPSIISPPTSLASLPDLVPPSMMVLCVRVGRGAPPRDLHRTYQLLHCSSRRYPSPPSILRPSQRDPLH